MLTFSSTMIVDELNSMAKEYGIPLTLRPLAPSSSMTINNLSANAIELERSILFIDRRAIPDTMPWRHHDSNVMDPLPSNVRAEDGRQLCENAIDLVVHEDEQVLTTKRRAQKEKERATSKRPSSGGLTCRTKKKKTAPLSMDLFDTDKDGSPQSGSRTVHFASPLLPLFWLIRMPKLEGAIRLFSHLSMWRRLRIPLIIITIMMMRSPLHTLHHLLVQNTLFILSTPFILRSM
ncbi:hypothetical protein Tco_1415109 [Tanacetum coccineum]